MIENLKKGYDSFLIREISKYIHQELKSGRTLDDVKKSLLDAGHDRNAVELAVVELEKHNYKEFDYNKIHDDAERELVEAIEVFVEDRLKHGISIERIKKVLKDYGHAETIIEKAIRNVKSRPRRFERQRIFPKTEMLEKEHILLTGLISVILLVAMSAAVVDENVFLVFLGFMPTTIIILLGFYYSSELKNRIFILPFIVCGLFFVMGLIVPQIGNMEYASLSVFNLLISMVIVLLYHHLESARDIESKNHERNSDKNKDSEHENHKEDSREHSGNISGKDPEKKQEPAREIKEKVEAKSEKKASRTKKNLP